MESDVNLTEILDLNLAYLLVAQRLLREDFATALVRLNFNEEMGKLVLSLSPMQLTRLARSNQFLFRFCLNENQLAQLTSNERDQGMAQLHTALLMTAARSDDAVTAGA